MSFGKKKSWPGEANRTHPLWQSENFLCRLYFNGISIWYHLIPCLYWLIRSVGGNIFSWTSCHNGHVNYVFSKTKQKSRVTTIWVTTLPQHIHDFFKSFLSILILWTIEMASDLISVLYYTSWNCSFSYASYSYNHTAATKIDMDRSEPSFVFKVNQKRISNSSLSWTRSHNNNASSLIM